MAVIVEVVEHNLAGGGAQQVPLTKFSASDPPKGAVVLMTGQSAYGFDFGDARQSMGFHWTGTAGFNYKTTGHTALHNSSNNDSDHHFDLFNALGRLTNGLQSVTDTITFTGFTSFTGLNISQTGSSTTKVLFLVVGGSDVLNANANSFESISGTGVQQFNQLSFTPNALIYASAGKTQDGGVLGGVNSLWGVADATSSYTADIRGFWGATGLWRSEWTNRFCNMRSRFDGSILLVGNWNGFITNGWEINWALNNVGAANFYFLAIELSDPGLWSIGKQTAPATPQTVSIPVGHVPEAAMIITPSLPDVPDQVATHGRSGVGFSDLSGKDFASTTYATDNATTSNIKWALKNDKSIHQIDASGNLAAEASLVANGNNLDAVFSTAAGDQFVFIYGSFGNAGVAGVNPTGTGTFSSQTAGDVLPIKLPTGTGIFSSQAAGNVTIVAGVTPTGTGTFSSQSSGDILPVKLPTGTGTFDSQTSGDVTLIKMPTGTGTFDARSFGNVTITGQVKPAGLGFFDSQTAGVLIPVKVPTGTGTFDSQSAGTVTVVAALTPTGTGTFDSQSAGNTLVHLKPAATGTFDDRSFGNVTIVGQIKPQGIGFVDSQTAGAVNVLAAARPTGTGLFSSSTLGSVFTIPRPTGTGLFSSASSGVVAPPPKAAVGRRLCALPEDDRLCTLPEDNRLCTLPKDNRLCTV